MRGNMAKKETKTDFSALKGINSAADFYGWKAQIIGEIGKTDPDYAARLGLINSLMDFFGRKEEILAKLGVSE